jgi:histidyl-tRNA synthetase
MQFDADTVGSASMAADAEMCMLAADTMEALGVPRGSYVVKVNNRKVLDGVMEAIGIGGEENAGKRLTVLRAIDKLDRLGVHGVRQLLCEGRKDESGDYTKGAGLDADQTDFVIAVIHSTVAIQGKAGGGEAHGDAAAFTPHPKFPFNDYFNKSANVQFAEGVSELSSIKGLAHASEYNDDRIRIDPSVVRGLEYYTGPVYEVELTFPVDGDDGKPVRFGSVGGGGRYDGLVARFRGEPVPATGFSIGVSRLLAALQHLGKVATRPEPGPVVVTVFDRDRIADYQRMVSTLRAADIRAEMYLGPGKFGPQMKYADRRNSPCVVIQGGDEKARGEVQIKDLILGAAIADIKDRDEYRKKQAEAQTAVAEDRLVDAVQAVLVRHGIRWN